MTSMPPKRFLKHFSTNGIVTAACVIALLHFGREVLEPIALASILSLVITPLVRRVRQFGMGQTGATLVSVGVVGACLIGVSIVLAIQVATVVADLPRYKASIRSKVEQVRDVTLGPLEKWEADVKGLALLPPVDTVRPRTNQNRSAAESVRPIPTQVQEQRPMQSNALSRLFALLWGPIGEFAVVLVLLVFILLEHEGLRDRIIRLTGEADVARTVQALGDTGEGVSRFFFSLFIVNLSFAAIVTFALWLVGIPHAALWGAFSGLFRFIPYIGVPVAATVIAAFAAAVDPGWSLLFYSVSLFTAFELLTANMIEPHVYGHSTGLTPLTVILSALFWGALWGPVGLLLSTPLTVCLVVAGRHVSALAPFTILLGDTPGIAEGLRFYRRALSADSEEILQHAHAYLKRNTLAKYCDHILLPGLALARADYLAGRIDQKQQNHIRTTIVRLAESLAPAQPGGRRARRPRGVSLANANMGTYLREMREARLGRWQGSLNVSSGSVILCAGLASQELLTELLARSLCHAGVDARSVSLDQPPESPGTDVSNLVSTVFLMYPQDAELTKWRNACKELHLRLPHAMFVSMRSPLDEMLPDESAIQGEADLMLHSFSEAVELVSDARGTAASSRG